MKSALSEFLRSFHLDQTEVSWEDIEKAQRACERTSKRSRRVTHRSLFHLDRSSFMWGERDCLGLFLDPESGAAAVYWVSNASGNGTLKEFDRVDPGMIQDYLSGLLAEYEWGPLQFYGTEISNSAPDLLPEPFFVRLLQEAYDRYPDESREDGDGEDWSNPADWVAEFYHEYAPG